jgi:UDP-N-acetylmuramyl tripeptide synthase
MGEIVGRLADLAIITSDNPRTEPPLTIIEHIRQGMMRSSPRGYSLTDLQQGFTGKGHMIEPDRRKAIEIAVRSSKRGDTVLIAGKGHETYQIIGRDTLPFDDRREVERALTSTRKKTKTQSAAAH